MRSYSKYISVETLPDVADSGMIFHLETFGADENITVDITVTDLGADDTEEDVALAIETAFNEQLEDYLYSGRPKFSNEAPAATVRVQRSGHVVSVWSQCSMELTVSDNSSNSILYIGSLPVLSTVRAAQEYAEILGYEFLLPDGTSMTDSQIVQVLLRNSIEICKYLRHKVVLSTYLNQFRGKNQKSVFTRPLYSVDKDKLWVRTKYPSGYVDKYYDEGLLNWVQSSGELNYIYDSSIVNTNSPFRMDNEIHLTFNAGFKTIPDEIVMALVELVVFEQTGAGDILSLSGGSFNVKTSASSTSKKTLLSSLLSSYKSK